MSAGGVRGPYGVLIAVLLSVVPSCTDAADGNAAATQTTFNSERAGSSQQNFNESGPPLHIDASDRIVAESAQELSQESDLVLEGIVRNTTTGRTVGERGTPTVTFEEVELEIISVISGSTQPGATLIVEQEYAEGDQLIASINGVPRLVVGDSGVFFLHRKTDVEERSVFRLTNSQSLLLSNKEVPGAIISTEAADDAGEIARQVSDLIG